MKIPLSFSRLSCFEQCERKFSYLHVEKSCRDSDNEFTLYGNRVHEMLEKYGRAKRDGTIIAREILADGRAFDEVKTFLPIVDLVLSQPGEVYFEHQMAITAEKTPCDWFAPEVWLRGIADILLINGTKAFIGDHKTGKIKDNPLQLKLFACLVFALFPAVDEVKTAFIWLAHNDITDQIFHRAQLAELWSALDPRLAAVQDAVDVGVFKAKPSGLCNYCPAKGICPDRKGKW